MDLTKLGVLDFLSGLKQKKFSVSDAVGEFVNRIKNDTYNTFITTINPDVLMQQAAECDANIEKNGVGKLTGVSIAVKDVFCTKDIKTTCASNALANFVPGYEATVTQNLWNEGGLLVGKTNMDQFSMGSSGSTSFFGSTINPYSDTTRPTEKLVPGGSSSGSAVAVAANYCHIALGGDTGGSIKQPASFCNLVGVRPTYGRCSRHGMIAYCDSLDQAGILAKNIMDAAYVFEIISGADEHDTTMYLGQQFKYDECFSNLDVSGLKVGIPKNISLDGMLPSIQERWLQVASFLEKRGAILCDVEIDYINLGVEVYYTITTADAFSNLARYDGVKFSHKSSKENNSLEEFYINNRDESFGDEVKKRIILGAHTLSDDHFEDTFMRAAKIKRLIFESFKKTFSIVDIILTPTTPNVAFAITDTKTAIEMYLNDVLTIPPNLAGLGGISVPCGVDSRTNLPIGMQVIPKWFDEKTAFKVCYLIEQFYK